MREGEKIQTDRSLDRWIMGEQASMINSLKIRRICSYDGDITCIVVSYKKKARTDRILIPWRHRKGSQAILDRMTYHSGGGEERPKSGWFRAVHDRDTLQKGVVDDPSTSILLFHYDVRGRKQDRYGGDQCEGRERNETKSINDHGGKFPIHDDLLLVIATLDSVGDEFELFQDALQLSIGSGRTAMRMMAGCGHGPRVR